MYQKETKNIYKNHTTEEQKERAVTLLEFDKITEQLAELANTPEAKEQCRTLRPLLSARELRARLRETTEARVILDQIGTPPPLAMTEVEALLETGSREAMLTAGQLEYLAGTLAGVRRYRDFLNRCKTGELTLPYYEQELDSLDEIRAEIETQIRNGKVDDHATRLLFDLRRECEALEEKMRSKAESCLRTFRDCFTDTYFTMRNGRICLPVKKECKNRIAGSVVGQSATGATLFIVPAAVARLEEELDFYRLEEENEERRILYTLTVMLCEQKEIFLQNQRIISKLDAIFARGKLSVQMQGVEAKITEERTMEIRQGRHPLLEAKTCVPLDFSLGKAYRGVVITGPNTGGKTVAIKTVGLLSLMAQSGLHIPCESAEICMHSQILCDIGDGQDLKENLSTFSSHIKNVLKILRQTTDETLVIMDELGSGTDPAEGMGIAIAILEELRKSGCLFLVTTHYPEVKTYASQKEEICNARMLFDRESLQPLYRLKVGEAGESCALFIAQKLGMPADMLRTAYEAAYAPEKQEREVQTPGDENGKRPESLRERPPFSVPEGTEQTLKKERSGRLVQEKKRDSRQTAGRGERFQIGDSVMVYPEKKIGIVYRTADEKGMLGVQLAQGKKQINQKRLKLHVAAGELYPEDYDFSIIFDTVENRKARHKMQKGHQPDLEIRTDKENLL